MEDLSVGSARDDLAGAVELWRRGQREEAIGLLEQLVARSPHDAELLRQLGAARQAAVTGWVQQGIELLRQRRPALALVSFARALQIDPNDAEALVGSISALLHLARARDALPFCERALRIAPAVAEVRANCAAVYLALKRPAEALRCADAALALRPDLFEAHYNRAEALLALGRPEDAAEAYDRTLALRPGFAPAHCGQGHAFRELSEPAAAIASYRRALSVEPEYAAARIGLLMATIPALPGSAAEQDISREVFASELARVEAWLGARPEVNALEVIGVAQPFFLAYQERENRELLSRWGTLCARSMQRWQASEPSFVSAPKPRADSRLHLGIVSAHLREHSVYRAIIKGCIEHLDGARVRISVWHLGGSRGAVTAGLQAHAELIECSGQPMRECTQAIRRHDIDVLLYPEIGMDPVTVQLASLRLARHQVASWGHPETTGLPTMDYYLSAAAFEPPGAQQFYRERLIPLPGIGCYYEPVGLDTPPADPARLGIAPGVPVLLCAGMPYKYPAVHDEVWLRIARGLSRCQLVFFESAARTLSRKLHERLRAKFRAGGLDPDQYLLMVPWLAPPDFFGLLRRADLYLDTLGFSGFNTVMQAVECALPIVAYEGRFLRGRFASGILRTMGLDALIARSPEGYVELVVRTARDPQRLEALRARLYAERHVLYRSQAAVDGLMSFLSGL